MTSKGTYTMDKFGRNGSSSFAGVPPKIPYYSEYGLGI
jgi:hypothetical protein